MICITTRFRLKHFWHLLRFFILYRGMKRDLKSASGLIRYALLMQNPLVCYTFSLWESEEAFRDFSNVPSHLHALREARPLCLHIWSAYWKIDAVSRHANQWPGSVPWPATISQPASLRHLLSQANKKEFV